MKKKSLFLEVNLLNIEYSIYLTKLNDSKTEEKMDGHESRGLERDEFSEIKINSNRFDQLRLIRGFAHLHEVAKKLGVRPSQLSNILSSRYSPTLRTVSKICRVLHCAPQDILTGGGLRVFPLDHN